MLTASTIIANYLSFFETRGHRKIANSPLVLQSDPTTLFTSSGMQPLVPYLLGESHPNGKRLVNVQNCFRAQDIDEIGDNRHTTFFRMLGNWSLGDYFKTEEIPWFWEFLTKKLELPCEKLYITIFKGIDAIPKDEEAMEIWTEVLEKAGLNPKDHIFSYSDKSNWWSRSGPPNKMPAGEPGGPSTEIFFEFDVPHNTAFGETCHPNCDCGRFMEIGNSVFMQYIKQADGTFASLPQKNIDFGGGLERLLAAVENQNDVFLTSLFFPIIQAIEKLTGKIYPDHAKEMRIITDHFTAAAMIAADGVKPSNKEQGYLLRRLIRRGFDNLNALHTIDIIPLLETIVTQYKDTNPHLIEKYEEIKNTLLEETQKYERTKSEAKKFIQKKYPSAGSGQAKKVGDELMGVTQISAEDAFVLYTTHGLSPTQIKSLGYTFDDQSFAEKMEAHQSLSKKGAGQKFKGGLADTEEKTVMGHTATHLLHQAIRDILGSHVHQTGSNITTERLRFDFNYENKLTDEQIKHVEKIVNEKITENLPVHFEMIKTEEAKKMGAIGLFSDTYGDTSKIYFIGSYSLEFCGGPHVDFTGRLKRFTIIKQENLGNGQKRIYANIQG